MGGARRELDAVSSSGAWSRWDGVRPDLQPPHHEVHEGLPTGEAKVTGERPPVVKEGFASWQLGADESVMLVGQLQDRVEEEGQNVERDQK